MERERRERAALRADAEFSTEFLNAARKVFQMIDDDGSERFEQLYTRVQRAGVLFSTGED